MRTIVFVLAAVLVLGALAWWFLAGGNRSQQVAAVSTDFRWLGPNDKIVIDAFEDPKVDGVVCYLSRPQRGGVKGSLGLTEDVSDVGIACRQVGPVTVRAPLDDGEKVFDERRSLVFKTLQVRRFFDKPHATIVYVAYSDRILSGSPQHSISAVPLMPWGSVAARMP
jgi:CreA protein